MDINSLTSLGTTTTRSNQVRDIVGFIDCRCGSVAKVLRGKAQLYEHCPECGLKMANGKKNTEYLFSNMRNTESKATEQKQEPDPEPQKTIKNDQELVIVKRSLLDKILDIQLFTL